ncbi:MAG: class I SAM-dependent methyltransferase [Devosia sp.]
MFSQLGASSSTLWRRTLKGLRRVENIRAEMTLGINTRGILETDIPDAQIYGTVDYPHVRSVLAALALTPSDVFIDVGCGRGRVLCCAALQDCAAVVGVELSPELCAEARVNGQKMRGRRTSIEVYQVAAQDFDYQGATALYFFNPFGAATLDLVLAKIRADTSGAPIRMAFVNIAEHTERVFNNHSWLALQEFWPAWKLGGMPVAFYSRA